MWLVWRPNEKHYLNWIKKYTQFNLATWLRLLKFILYFFPGLFFIIFSYICPFMAVWGFGVGVLKLVLEVWVFSRWSLNPVVWGLLGFMRWGYLYKHKRITLVKKLCEIQGIKCWQILFFWISNLWVIIVSFLKYIIISRS